MLGEVILVLILCIGALFWWWQRSARLYWEKNGVSYIAGPPIIGAFRDVILFKKSIAELFVDFYEKFKDEPITGIYFFHKPSLIIRHPEIIRNILVKDFNNFMDRGMNSEDTIGKDNLFAVKSVRWKAIRSKLSPVFTTGKLKNFFLLMLNVTQTLEEKLSMDIADEPREYEMRDLASYFTTDTITICIFGVQANSLLNPNGEFYRSARKTFDLNWKRSIELLTCFFLPELAIRLRFTLFSKETNNFLRSSINYVMEERVKSGTRRNDMIDALIAMKNEDPDLFKGDTIVAQAGSFLLANFETSSSVISFALYELARHPEIQENLRNEIKDYAMKYGSLQYETLNEMEYLNGVVQETLRLYPPAPFLDRICAPCDESDSYSLEPYHKFAISRGTPVYIPIFAIHRDPKYFNNPLEFIPERFSRENWDSINQYVYLPFGFGPRKCIGSRFGYLQVKMALYTIISKYRVEATERTPKTIEFDGKALTTHSIEPLYMNLRRI